MDDANLTLTAGGPCECHIESECGAMPPALERLSLEKWDVVVVDQTCLSKSPLRDLQVLSEAGRGAEIILLAGLETPLASACEWLNGIERLRLLPKPLDLPALRGLLERLATWRQKLVERGEHANPEAQDLNVELARLSIQAMFDQLTCLLRREEMVVRGAEELSRSRRTGQRLLCIMCDIDHFKRVNDVFGHQTGDRTLQRVASLLNEGSRPYDLAGRMGGEEFMLLIPGPSIEEGERIAERLRIAIQDFPWHEESLPNITLSFGVAELLAGHFGDLESLSSAADAALYQAKRQGRNRVCLMTLTPEDTHPEELEETEDMRPRLLLVDDTPLYLNELAKLLANRYQVEPTTSPMEALAWAEKRHFDLVITDQNMPGMYGHELLARIKCLQPHCMRIVMTSHAELSSAIQAINEGEVYRYIIKPWHDEDLLLIVYQALEYRSMVNRLQNSDRETIKALAGTIELKDRSTQGHYHRVAELSLLMAGTLEYSRDRLQRLEYAAWLHDIGKIGIPDRILKKSHLRNASEEKMIREHPHQGALLVSAVEHLMPIAPFIRHHHERYDGHGYPDGLAGKAIPEESRIIAIANAYDGMLTPRHDRPVLVPEAALEQIKVAKETLFDPALVEIFEEIRPRRSAQAAP